MKNAMKLIIIVVVALMAVSLASATATLSKTESLMGFNDEETVEFCISGSGTGSEDHNNVIPEIPEFGGITATLVLFAAIGIYLYKRKN
jgi:hypothetical protein